MAQGSRVRSASPNSTAGSKPTLRDVFSLTFIAVSLINFIGMCSYYTTFVVTAGFLMGTYGSSAGFAGLSAGIVVIGCLVGRFFTGRVVHTMGYKRILVTGVVLYFLTNLAYTVIDSPEVFLLARLVSGVAVGVIGTATGTLVALITPRQFLGRGISYFSMSTALALCFGPFIGVALAEPLGFRGVFTLCAALSAVSVALALITPINLERRRPTGERPRLSDFIEPSVATFSLFIALFCLAWGCIQAFIAPYSKEIGAVDEASFFFLAYAIVILLTRPITGKIYDMQGPDIIFYPAIVSLAAGLLLLWVSWGGWTVILAGMLMGFGFGNIQSLGQSNAVAMVPRSRFAQATSTYFIFFDLGTGSAPYFFGLLQQQVGYQGIFGINCLTVLLGVPLYWLLRHQRKRRPSLGEELPISSR